MQIWYLFQDSCNLPSTFSRTIDHNELMAELTWKALLDPTRTRTILGGKPSNKVPDEARTEFERDRDRAISSSPFRRLSGKTQVFPLDPNDLVRTRLTHSLEVAAVGEGLASQAARNVILPGGEISEADVHNISKIAETCALLHDIGNPPFGHAGELAMSTWFAKGMGAKIIASLGSTEQMASDFTHFEGNAQTMRLVLNTHLVADKYGLNLTAATTSALRKYLAPSNALDTSKKIHERSKPGLFLSEQDDFGKIADVTGTTECRHPITYLVEAADDIVYSAVDLEDGIKKRLISLREVQDFLESNCGDSDLFRRVQELANRQMSDHLPSSSVWRSDYPQAFRIAMISITVRAVVDCFKLRYSEIMRGDYHEELVADDACTAKTLIEQSKRFLRNTVFQDENILRLEIKGRKVIHDLMDLFWEAIEQRIESDEKGTKTYGGKIYLLMSPNYRHTFEERLKSTDLREKLYAGLQLLTDQVCNMTDGYACRLHEDLTNG